MERIRFETDLIHLQTTMLSVIKDHFDKTSRNFDPTRFLAETACSLDEVVRGAYFFGAEVFPIDIPIKENHDAAISDKLFQD